MATERNNLILVGMMGAGKTTVGRLLARRLRLRFVDSDQEIESRCGVKIPVIFEQNERTDITKVPFFGDLPYLGWLFKNNTTSSSKTELLVFITPRIVNERLNIR